MATAGKGWTLGISIPLAVIYCVVIYWQCVMLSFTSAAEVQSLELLNYIVSYATKNKYITTHRTMRHLRQQQILITSSSTWNTGRIHTLLSYSLWAWWFSDGVRCLPSGRSQVRIPL